MAAAELNGYACASCALTVPGYGLWHAAVELTDDIALPVGTPVVLRTLDQTWRGAVIAGGSVDGHARYRIQAGAGNWGTELKPRAYANDAGVTVARLLTDVALEADEVISNPPTTRLGAHYSRPRAPASFLLNALAPRGWYAGADGAVAFGERPSAKLVASLVTVRRDPAQRVVELAATDSLAGAVPGATTEYGAAADVDIEIGADGVRVRLYAASAPNRRAQAIADMLAALDPGARWRGTYEYRIVSQTAERLNLQPVRSRSLLPDLARVPVRAGVPGVKATHAPGAQVLVVFLDGDLSRPAVVGFDAPDSPGWMPLFLELGGPGALGVARQTDPVVAGPFGGTIVTGSARIKASL